MATLIITGIVILLAAWLVKQYIGSPKNLPPGPPGYPLIGVGWTLFRARDNILQFLGGWAKEYGDIVHFRFGGSHFFLLNSLEIMKEAFQNPLLNGRQPAKFLREVTGLFNNGVVGSFGDTWREQRQFVHSVFRSLGVGKKSYEDTIANEISQLTGAIEDYRGRAFDPHELFTSAISNIICTVVFGTQYSYSDRDFCKILDALTKTFNLIGTGGSLVQLPIPRISQFPIGPFRELAECTRNLNRFVLDMIESHKQTFDPADTRDFIDLYLKKMAETKGSDSSFDVNNLTASITDLFLAGTETTATSLKWSVMFMMDNPEVQERVQAEIDKVVGRSRLPTLDDRKDLIYTNAVLLECMRLGTVAPLGVAHTALEDATLGGYSIPKGGVLFANIWQILRDKRYWDQPEEFKPERFLSRDGRLLKVDEFVPFSTGRRVCLGEQLGRMELFLFFSALLHRFTFKKPANSPPLSFKGELGLSLNTGPFTTCFVERDTS
ncbi:cytochrome P450 2J2-like [Diadema setosum]|uniref:cytochrome P450 2J2-like n=1 Tax=Diadema setosum TaxID=31175 RepID=UPI003B3B4A5F